MTATSSGVTTTRAGLPVAAVRALRDAFGPNFDTSAEMTVRHGHTLTWLPNEAPSGVIFAENKQDVCKVVTICSEYGVAVIPFGAGTSLEGQVNAPFGGVSLDLSRMDKLITVAADDQYVITEPGLRHEKLNSLIAPMGLFFSVDPGANATLGGMASTRASGTNAVRYGTMFENTLALEVVLANGEVIRTGTKARKSACGYDLTHLFVGSEGTLGIITELTLRVYPIPKVIAGGRCTFENITKATSVVIEAFKQRIDLARIELLDHLCIRACNAYSGLSLDEAPTLFVEFHGSREHVEHEAERFRALVTSVGRSFEWTTDAAERAKLWSARHDAWWAIHHLFPGKSGVTTDVCVPISKLSDAIAEAQKAITTLSLDAVIVGHVGDGNFHVLIMLDPGCQSDLRKTKELIAQLNTSAIQMDGTCTGEHGIGQGKMDALAIEHSSALGTMQAIKRALDPKGLLNPGKLFGATGN
jgi:D-lactate dehydrogenase (cytochrome)